MSEKRNNVTIDQIEEGQPFRAFINHCYEKADYVKIGDRVLLVIATVAHDGGKFGPGPLPFNAFEYIPVDDVRHVNPDLPSEIYADEVEGGAEEWR